MCSDTNRTVLRAAALALAMIALVGCGPQEDTTAREAISLDTVLRYGENQYIIDKYRLEGHDTRRVLNMLETIGRDGVEQWPEYASDLRARGFALAPDQRPMKQRSAGHELGL